MIETLTGGRINLPSSQKIVSIEFKSIAAFLFLRILIQKQYHSKRKKRSTAYKLTWMRWMPRIQWYTIPFRITILREHPFTHNAVWQKIFDKASVCWCAIKQRRHQEKGRQTLYSFGFRPCITISLRNPPSHEWIGQENLQDGYFINPIVFCFSKRRPFKAIFFFSQYNMKLLFFWQSPPLQHTMPAYPHPA